jgi:hypothetical protein
MCGTQSFVSQGFDPEFRIKWVYNYNRAGDTVNPSGVHIHHRTHLSDPDFDSVFADANIELAITQHICSDSSIHQSAMYSAIRLWIKATSAGQRSNWKGSTEQRGTNALFSFPGGGPLAWPTA